MDQLPQRKMPFPYHLVFYESSLNKHYPYPYAIALVYEHDPERVKGAKDGFTPVLSIELDPDTAFPPINTNWILQGPVTGTVFDDGERNQKLEDIVPPGETPRFQLVFYHESYGNPNGLRPHYMALITHIKPEEARGFDDYMTPVFIYDLDLDPDIELPPTYFNDVLRTYKVPSDEIEIDWLASGIDDNFLRKGERDIAFGDEFDDNTEETRTLDLF